MRHGFLPVAAYWTACGQPSSCSRDIGHDFIMDGQLDKHLYLLCGPGLPNPSPSSLTGCRVLLDNIDGRFQQKVTFLSTIPVKIISNSFFHEYKGSHALQNYLREISSKFIPHPPLLVTPILEKPFLQFLLRRIFCRKD